MGALLATVFGFAVLALGVLYFLFKLYVAYDAARDPLGAGGVPTLDGAIIPPVLLVVGLFMIEQGRPDWPRLNLVWVWLAATAFGFAVHFAIARLVERGDGGDGQKNE